MKIGIDISQIVYKGSGVARFTEGLVHAILDFDLENKWLFFFSSFRQDVDNKIVDLIHTKGHELTIRPIPPSVLSLLWNDLHNTSLFIPDVHNLDWFITSDWTEPKLGVKKATVVHDLVFKKYPETVHYSILKTQEKRLRWVSEESSIIFADSQSTAHDLQQIYTIDSSKIVVNYPGVIKTQVTDDSFRHQTLVKYKLPQEFILTVGKLEPRKNIKRLIEAYMTLLQKNPHIPSLAVVGMKGWDNEIHVKSDKILLLGYVSDEELSVLYETSVGFIYPSLYEGFGYPVVEAMLSGCPVATSNTSSLSEIAKDSALLFNPEDVNDIATQVSILLHDEQIRKNLSHKGQGQAAKYTWKTYYDTLITTLKKAL